jgi:hypothetical protein
MATSDLSDLLPNVWHDSNLAITNLEPENGTSASPRMAHGQRIRP